MENFGLDMSVTLLIACCFIALAAGVVKGMVGFGLPMIMVSLLGSFVTPDVALAGLIVPTLVTNVMQALRQGPAAAVATFVQFRIFMITTAVFLVLSAQLYLLLPVWLLLLAIGAPVTLFSVMQLAGIRFSLRAQVPWIEALVGAIGGFIGGLSGVWGPPMTAYLTALNTEKRAQVRAQGVAFGLGSVLLLGAHWNTGVVRAETFMLSVLLTFPAIVGMWLGGHVQDRIDQDTFRKATLILLLVAGLNLIRRSMFGV